MSKSQICNPVFSIGGKTTDRTDFDSAWVRVGALPAETYIYDKTVLLMKMLDTEEYIWNKLRLANFSEKSINVERVLRI